MKKLILMLVAGAIAGVFVTGCSQPAEGNTETGTASGSAPAGKPMAESAGGATTPEANAPAANAPEANAPEANAPAGNTPPEDKK